MDYYQEEKTYDVPGDLEQINRDIKALEDQQKMSRLQSMMNRADDILKSKSRPVTRSVSMAARASVAPSRMSPRLSPRVSSSASVSSMDNLDKMDRLQSMMSRADDILAKRYNKDSLLRGGASSVSISAADSGKPYRCAQNARGDFRFTAEEIRSMAKNNGIPNWKTLDLDTLCKQMGIFNDINLATYRQQPAVPLSYSLSSSTPSSVLSDASVASIQYPPVAPYSMPAVSSVASWNSALPEEERKQIAMRYAPVPAQRALSENNPYRCSTAARGKNRIERSQLNKIAEKVGIPSERYLAMTMDELCRELGIYNSGSDSNVAKSMAPPSYYDAGLSSSSAASSSAPLSYSTGFADRMSDESPILSATVVPSVSRPRIPSSRSSALPMGEPRRSDRIKRMRE